MTGIVLTTPGGTKFWHPAKDAKSGLAEMEQMHREVNLYGAAWDNPATVIEFVTRPDPTGPYTVTDRLRGPNPDVAAPPVPATA